MLGLQSDAAGNLITFAPHVPADWTSFAMHNVRVGNVSADFQYRKTSDSVMLEVKRTGTGDCWVEFSPAFSLRTEVAGVEMNGRRLPFKISKASTDQHASMRFSLSGGTNTVVIHLRKDFGLSWANELPALGSASRSLRIVSESWSAGENQLAVEVSGLAGMRYDLDVWNPAAISAVDGASLTKAGKLQIRIPDGPAETYVHSKILIHFGNP